MKWATPSVIFLVIAPTSAHAYRPFDLTDADVAGEGEFELELGIAHLREGSDK